jgi:putative membrane protein
MESKSSLNKSIDSASKHYSSMFSLPSFRTALVAVAALCMIIGLSTLAVTPSQKILYGLALGLAFFALTFISDFLMTKITLKNDPIFSLRRTLVVSVVGWILWLVFNVLGLALSFSFGFLMWVKLCLLGYAAVITLRIIVLIATSTSDRWRKGISVLLQPTFCLVAFVVFWVSTSIALPLMQVLLFIIVSPIICFLAVSLFFYSIERLSQKNFSMRSIPLFRAFIVNWVTDQNAPMEKYLEEMGEDKDIEVALLKFDSSKPKAAIIVPLVHPGPFKNIGSSLLPSLLKQGFEKEYDCTTCTPLGILGHELDLASQEQNHKIVSQVIASAKFNSTAGLASPSVRITEGTATASGQIFGDTIFLSFSLAPETTEDLPQGLGRFVVEEAAKYGLNGSVVVNAHNSITDLVDVEAHLNELQTVASKCIQKAVKLQTRQFSVGADSVFPKEFSLRNGMGTGGITAIVIQVETQKTVYVVIDGNNMVPGLREKILASLDSEGFDSSEVFTTDTHAVSALITGGRAGRRGYHPIGEAMDQELLTCYICDVAKNADSNLEVANAGYLHFTVPQVRVIGEERLKSITTLVDMAIKKAKQMLPIFGLEGLLLILLLLFF